MGILSRFADIMKANINSLIENTEAKNADKLLAQYLRDAKDNLAEVKAETAGVIAEETAAGRRVVAINEEIAKLSKYAEQAVLAGNDTDARKFLEGKIAAEGRKAEAEKAFEIAKVNSDRMRQLTKKLNEDIIEAGKKMDELKAKLAVVEQQEKMNELVGKISSVGDQFSDYDRLADAVQKRIDAADAKLQLDNELDENKDINSLMKKYDEVAETEKTDSTVDNELAALKAKLGKNDAPVLNQ